MIVYRATGNRRVYQGPCPFLFIRDSYTYYLEIVTEYASFLQKDGLQ
jgi:hypothetical protein